MRVVGLTGGVATGKSTVARILSEDLGLQVVDADQAARQVVEPGQPALRQLVDAFGSEILTADGRLDRAAMRSKITDDASARATLNQITHPAIAQSIGERLAQLRDAGAPVAVVEAALMVETGSYQGYDALLVVTTEPATQLQRLMDRDGLSEDIARKFIATQMPLRDKEAVADAVVRNNGDHASLRRRVRAAWAEL